jgi:magnesium transporter
MPERMKSIAENKKRELLEHIRGGNPHLLRESLDRTHPAELSAILRIVSKEEETELINALDNVQLANVFRLIVDDTQLKMRLVDALPRQRMAQIVATLSARTIRDLFDGISQSRVKKLLDALPTELRRETETCIQKPANGLSAVITQDFMKVPDEIPVAEALKMFRETPHSNERPNQVYVVDARGRLSGAVDLHRLLLAEDYAEEVGRIATECPLRIKSDTGPAAAAGTLLYYGIESAPVTDAENRLVGVITSAAAYRFLEKDREEKLDLMAGIALMGSDTGSRLSNVFIAGAARTFLILSVVLAVSVILEAIIRLTGDGKLSLILPAALIVIAAGRLFLRQTMVLYQKRCFTKLTGISTSGARIRINLISAFVFSIFAGCLALVTDFRIEAVAFVSLSTFLAAAFGAVAGLAMTYVSKNVVSARNAFLNPALLAITDLFGLLILYGLYKLFI